MNATTPSQPAGGLALRIEQWRAWAPGLEDAAAWQAWAAAPQRQPDAQQAQPSCAFLPTMQRRRLSRLARMSMEVAWPLCGEHEQLPFVFGSRHGETPRTYALLGEIADGQPLSPTQFGLSVHNAIAGQWSILRGQRGESVALAGEADTFEHAMLEGAMQLAAGAAAALVVVAEESPHAAYVDWITDVPFSYAVALRLGRVASTADTQDGSDWLLSLRPSVHAPAMPAAERCAWPHALDFLRALLVRESSLEHVWKTRQWNWQRTR